MEEVERCTAKPVLCCAAAGAQAGPSPPLDCGSGGHHEPAPVPAVSRIFASFGQAFRLIVLRVRGPENRG